ncbi:hypothetical protein HN695_03675 [Candidatus Woesearchaeota archaeon]|jgi:hypothetical protein|nr:hypothetical protein [Candidatus Woesearchaeota archaeon]MBT5272248.1 hypothetical protein [Candidatus Woesearchaeota archaeon]MBT6041159.1 hypothetical protein [Candidatus Woesearchaeota archaeon]MBT6336520.1 hypothetical protein [Candidatus Woesearchaeota archaeon]MBT7927410.1 hypothetical protein [Candidatus Woesearchaeota archaeon]
MATPNEVARKIITLEDRIPYDTAIILLQPNLLGETPLIKNLYDAQAAEGKTWDIDETTPGDELDIIDLIDLKGADVLQSRDDFLGMLHHNSLFRKWFDECYNHKIAGQMLGMGPAIMSVFKEFIYHTERNGITGQNEEALLEAAIIEASRNVMPKIKTEIFEYIVHHDALFAKIYQLTKEKADGILNPKTTTPEFSFTKDEMQQLADPILRLGFSEDIYRQIFNNLISTIRHVYSAKAHYSKKDIEEIGKQTKVNEGDRIRYTVEVYDLMISTLRESSVIHFRQNGIFDDSALSVERYEAKGLEVLAAETNLELERRKISVFEESLRTLEKEYGDLRAENFGLRERLEKNPNDYEELERELRSIKRKYNAIKIFRKQEGYFTPEEVEEYRKEDLTRIAELEKRVTYMGDAVARLKEDSGEKGALLVDTEGKHSDITGASESKELEKEVQKKPGDPRAIGELLDKLAAAEANAADYEERCGIENARAIALARERDDYKRKLAYEIVKIEELVGERDEYKGQAEAEKVRADGLADKNTKLEARVVELSSAPKEQETKTTDVKKVNSDIAVYVERIANLESALATKEAEAKEYSGLYEEAREELGARGQELKSLNDELILYKEKEDLLAERQSQLDRQEGELRALETSLQKVDGDAGKGQTNYEELSKQVTGLIDTLKQEREDIAEERRTIANERETIATERTELKEQATLYEGLIEEAEREKAAYATQVTVTGETIEDAVIIEEMTGEFVAAELKPEQIAFRINLPKDKGTAFNKVFLERYFGKDSALLPEGELPQVTLKAHYNTEAGKQFAVYSIFDKVYEMKSGKAVGKGMNVEMLYLVPINTQTENK